MPKALMLLGYGGLIPFFLGAILTLLPESIFVDNHWISGLARQFLQMIAGEMKTAGDYPALIQQMLSDWGRQIVLFYGAIILSFLGGINWGLFLTQKTAMSVVVLISGVLPSLIGFFVLIVFAIPAISHYVTMPILIMGYIFIWLDHKRLAEKLSLPGGFMRLRTHLSLGAGLSFLIVAL